MFSPRLLVATVALCASVASATTTKMKDFSAYGGGLTANPHTDGMAIIKYDAAIAGDHLHLHMQDLHSLPPGGMYGVAIIATNSGDFDYSNPLAFDVNPAGNGSFDVDLPTLPLGPTPTVYIYYWDGASDFSTISGFDPAQFRAIGTIP